MEKSRKPYQAPEIASDLIQVGVFGCYPKPKYPKFPKPKKKRR